MINFFVNQICLCKLAIVVLWFNRWLVHLPRNQQYQTARISHCYPFCNFFSPYSLLESMHISDWNVMGAKRLNKQIKRSTTKVKRYTHIYIYINQHWTNKTLTVRFDFFFLYKKFGSVQFTQFTYWWRWRSTIIIPNASNKFWLKHNDYWESITQPPLQQQQLPKWAYGTFFEKKLAYCSAKKTARAFWMMSTYTVQTIHLCIFHTQDS